MNRAKSPLWRCPNCKRKFANRNQTHFCSNVTLESHFTGKPPITRELFDAFLGEVKKHGPVKVLPEKTRIALQVRMSFAAVMTRRGYLRGHLVLAERCDDSCFFKIESFSPRNHVHQFALRDKSQLSASFQKHIAAAYAVGCQHHLRSPSCCSKSVAGRIKLDTENAKN